jgi:hypothetical protein
MTRYRTRRLTRKISALQVRRRIPFLWRDLAIGSPSLMGRICHRMNLDRERGIDPHLPAFPEN